MNRVAVVVLNWRNGTDTVECLDSLWRDAQDEITSVVICDNDSGDDSVPSIRAWAMSAGVSIPEFRAVAAVDNSNLQFEAIDSGGARDGEAKFILVHTGANRGFAGGTNVGLAFLESNVDFDLVLLLNNDTIVPAGSIKRMAERFEENAIGMCGCTVVYHHTPTKVQAYAGAQFNALIGRARHLGAGASVDERRSRTDVEKRLDYVLGAVLMISRPCLEAIGMMDERYFLYFEEIDWATRARRQGFTLGFAPTAVVYHKEGGTIGSSSDTRKRSALSQYYLFRSRILFTRKFFPYFLPTAALFSLAQLMRSAMGRDFRRVGAGLRGVFGLPYPEDGSS